MFGATFGGLGLFLFGMIVLTDALKALAGDSLKTFLNRFTGGALSSMATGCAATTVLQSSSATTLATIGFVSAGLLNLSQAIAIILGANLGTTSTGWIVATLGLKLSISKLALPLIGFGAIAKLMFRGRIAQIGVALAGFGLIFVGIDTMQLGMEGLSKSFNPASFPGGSFFGRMLLVLIGVLMTVVMQSSSAALAATLTALYAGTLDLDQSVALVVGQNIGTTVTAGFACIGVSVPAKRAALAHVLFNLLTGFVIFLALPWIVPSVTWVCSALSLDDGASQLAFFHTGFNLFGVIFFLPLIGRLEELVVRMIPDRGPSLTRHLGPLVARTGSVALEAALRTICEIGVETLKALRLVLSGEEIESAEAALLAASEAVEKTRQFLALVEENPESEASDYTQHLRLLHSLDHLDRLIEACSERNRAVELGSSTEVARVMVLLTASIDAVSADPDRPGLAESLKENSQAVAKLRRKERGHLLSEAAQHRLPPKLLSDLLEVTRWVDRVAFHLWRAFHHLNQGDQALESGDDL
ncbi:MAG: Na/Pi symporter [Planctomycetota bacterium]|nr:Na/Pi symporter [Planctomycetota bacterium]